MHRYRWIEDLSNGEFSASSIISESPPGAEGSWLPIDRVKEYTLIFVVDEISGRVNQSMILLDAQSRLLTTTATTDTARLQEARLGEESVSMVGINLPQTTAQHACLQMEWLRWQAGGKRNDDGMRSTGTRSQSTTEEAGLNSPTLTFKGQFVIADSNATLREGSATSPMIHIFFCTAWTGEPIETEEMKPRWFRLPSYGPSSQQGKDDLEPIPFDSMWPEQRLFLAKLLQLPPNEYMYGRVDYDTMALPSEELWRAPRNDLEISTKDGTHRVQCWRFIKTGG
ncbi:hypothetical protein QFC21_003687 [Naganishia friedmannii]|uniref:Uncharacterized protein n=1 Tax=Naganishia friedmannii TaxID=89922 RepID=A0ACC2VMN5_9TREE|nr:hypothetical protein QFC21_003687 [Naganishia friedmannii]